MTEIPLGTGDEAVVRMPTPDERAEHHLDVREPVIEIHRQDGTTEIYAAGRVRVAAADPTPAAAD